jgi:predicted N-acetyltransferase YhbS
MLQIRLATPDDEPAAQAVSAAAFAELRSIYRPNAKAHAHRARLETQTARLVAVDEMGRVIGTVKFFREDDGLRLMALAVARDCRRQGVARQLIEHVAGQARAEGRNALKMRTIRETGNVAIFERHGFHVVSEGPDDFMESPTGATLIDVDMRRDVTSS